MVATNKKTNLFNRLMRGTLIEKFVGFGTFAGSDMMAGDVVWAKLATLAEGTQIASSRAL